MHVVNCLNEYIYKWRENDFTTCEGYEVKHRKIFEEIDYYLQTMNVEVVWIERDSDEGNIEADRLGKLTHKINIRKIILSLRSRAASPGHLPRKLG